MLGMQGSEHGRESDDCRLTGSATWRNHGCKTVIVGIFVCMKSMCSAFNRTHDIFDSICTHCL